MRLQMQAIHFDADSKLFSFIQQKLDKLDTFYDRITSGEVFLKLDKGDTNKQQKKRIDVKLYVPGGSVFVSEEGTTFEEATDLAVDTLKMKVKKHKDKRMNAKAPRLDENGADQELKEEDEVSLITEEIE